ncbi:hypothetical protein K491DRAFT_713713 [Lophiostoma macrostomum CBS 122681]|uniref:Lytic polysaccharide monooxygenase n=1 Tax=Lophiostoma macrostomum CBS 122681 TaxID=1314788 RepID=A0A6A6TFX0_9PLEO|nr:hypothetical protein K491DRAFT_713713 [Lophiostoma macrostomum CBS 122681]
MKLVTLLSGLVAFGCAQETTTIFNPFNYLGYLNGRFSSPVVLRDDYDGLRWLSMNLCFPGPAVVRREGYNDFECSDPWPARLGHLNASNVQDFCINGSIVEGGRTWEADFQLGPEGALSWRYAVLCEWDEELGDGPAYCSHSESACDFTNSATLSYRFTDYAFDYQTVEIVTSSAASMPLNTFDAGKTTLASPQSTAMSMSPTIPGSASAVAASITSTASTTAVSSSPATTNSTNATTTHTQTHSKGGAASPITTNGTFQTLVLGLIAYFFGL